MLISHHLHPPISGEMISKDIPLCLRYWLPLAITKKYPLFLVFSGILPETTAPKYPPFPRKWERACGPVMHSSGGPESRGRGSQTTSCIIHIERFVRIAQFSLFFFYRRMFTLLKRMPSTINATGS